MEICPSHTGLRLKSSDHKWMESRAVREIRRIVAVAGGRARVVGGAVRDALAGRLVQDIDFAVSLPPLEVMALFQREGIKVVPTGIVHGTVTVVIEGKGYELTTLRRDEATDGRHAQVAFTNDWRQDAARRDFTFNALYLNDDGTIEDYFGGLDDLKARRIRFIGDPAARINEDYLRILRAFRFMAQMGSDTVIEPESLAACAAAARGLLRLSAERVTHELIRLFAAPDPVPAVTLMTQVGVLPVLLAPLHPAARLARFIEAEKHYGLAPDPVGRMAALYSGPCENVLNHIRFSRRERERFTALCRVLFGLAEPVSAASVRQKLYDFSRETVEQGLLLASLDGPREVAEGLKVAATWERPVFPLRGRDLIERGLTEGPELGRIVRQAELWWREQDFRPTKCALLDYALTLRAPNLTTEEAV